MTGPDFRLWTAGRIVFREQDGSTVTCPLCGLVGARITYLPGRIVHVAGWEPVPGNEHLSRLVAVEFCGVKGLTP